MASMMATTGAYLRSQYWRPRRENYGKAGFSRRFLLCQQQQKQHDPTKPTAQIARREIILRSSELAVVGAIFNLRRPARPRLNGIGRSSTYIVIIHCSGKKPDYLGVGKKQQQLALCPATNNCISTSENVSDSAHYAPPWNYNGGRPQAVSRQVAMDELVQVIKTTKPDKYSARIVEQNSDYVHAEYASPILGLVDDVEFWFPPGSKSTVEYRSASRLGDFDFYANRKRIKALRQELEKKGWTSENHF
ncbi:unnamed protein product [Linum tenue]|uniref:DUF1499 domain-containing protein n=1 Tax=Linum tenue TaxID=586396 RepID=A0AAV0IW24_9ROSI|nr:unnamed protein product [Linum tenue]